VGWTPWHWQLTLDTSRQFASGRLWGLVMSVRSRRLLVPALVLCVGSVSGCSLGQLELRGGSVTAESAAVIKLSPAGAGKAIEPNVPIVVEAQAGRLTQVLLSGPDGPVPGTLSGDGQTWTAEPGALSFASKYSLTATAVDRSGLASDISSSLTTVAPSGFLGMLMSPRDGATVGVGLPVTLTLDHQLSTDTAKAAFEKTLTVTVAGVAPPGSWHWNSDSRVTFRPKDFWPGNSTVKVTASTKGVHLSQGLWGDQDHSFSFTTADSMISYVDMQTDQMTVTRNGDTIKVIPITTGKPGFETRSGIKVIENKELTRVMDAATGGTDPLDPEYYRLEVQFAMRLTDSGEFLHAAPWSVAHQGKENVSHGCTGMSLADAQWMYENSRIGDVVEYTGSARPMESSNGIGLWNISWSRWKAGSALAGSTRIATGGSDAQRNLDHSLKY